VCYRVTPELYLGYARGQFGNPEGIRRDQPFDYRDVGHHAEGMVYLSGRWAVAEEFSRSEAAGASISIRYTAKDVNLVLVPTTDGMSGAEIELSPDQHPGADVRTQDHKLVVTVDQPRMYSLVANSGVSSGALTLKALAPGLNVYAFTFISCAVA
jgi:hypothetical protein